MNLHLPARHDGTRETVNAGKRRVVIIGANGSGKSRFAECLISEMEGKAFRISALNALYRSLGPDPLPGSIDTLFAEAVQRSTFLRDDVPTQFDRLMMLMVLDEMLNLLAGKVGGAEPGAGRLDSVIKAWQEIFPGSKVLYEGGKMLFSRTPGESYSPVKLSDGEKAVLYYFGAAMYAPKGAVIFVDSPGLFLHPSITGAIWDRVEAMRPDCSFIYTTHDIEFLSSRPDNLIIWVRDYDAASVTWDYVAASPRVAHDRRPLHGAYRCAQAGAFHRGRRHTFHRRQAISARVHRLHREVSRQLQQGHRGYTHLQRP